MPRTLQLTLLAGTLMLGTVPAHAGMTEPQKALWGASAQAPTTFALPAGRDAAVMDKAAAIIDTWGALDPYMAPTHVRTHTATRLQTDEPTALNLFGVKVTDTPTDSGSVITVDTMAYEGKAFQISQQRRDANKRAHLLAYLLEQYAGVSTTGSAAAPVSAPVTPARTLPVPASDPAADRFAPELRRLHDLLAAGQYDDALRTLDSLRTAVAAKVAPKTGGK